MGLAAWDSGLGRSAGPEGLADTLMVSTPHSLWPNSDSKKCPLLPCESHVVVCRGAWGGAATAKHACSRWLLQRGEGLLPKSRGLACSHSLPWGVGVGLRAGAMHVKLLPGATGEPCPWPWEQPVFALQCLLCDMGLNQV